MIKAIVFDCYGVLVGSSFWDIYHAAGGDVRKDEQFIDDMLARANAALISNDDFNRTIAERLHITIEEWADYTQRMQQPNKALLAYMRDELKPQYKIGLLSNANKDSVERRLPAEDLALLDAVIVSGEVGYMKPDPEIFELTAKELDVTFDEMVFIDDLQDYVDAAGTLGIHSIRYTSLEALRPKLAEILTK
ncbi:MAG TPA: HAD-IA family hydrolase [Candidatus Saccharimonadales bacterium]|nr:HAD-IA family hydrolase [Candidatus Saccharimonadales bacterium]